MRSKCTTINIHTTTWGEWMNIHLCSWILKWMQECTIYTLRLEINERIYIYVHECPIETCYLWEKGMKVKGGQEEHFLKWKKLWTWKECSLVAQESVFSRHLWKNYILWIVYGEQIRLCKIRKVPFLNSKMNEKNYRWSFIFLLKAPKSQTSKAIPYLEK